MEDRFPGTSSVATSHVIKEAFRSSTKRRSGGERLLCIFGVRLRQPSAQSTSLGLSPPDTLSASTNLLPVVSAAGSSGLGVGTSGFLLQPMQLHPIVAHSTSQLLLDLQLERDKRFALEQQVCELTAKVHECSSSQPVAQYQEDLQSEVDSVVSSGLSLLHGPGTEDHFMGFTLDGVVQELKFNCPQMYKLFQQLPRTQRNVTDDVEGLPLQELKGVMSLCTLLNARSARAKGVQLMISLMLVARATNKQVHNALVAHIYLTHETITTPNKIYTYMIQLII